MNEEIFYNSLNILKDSDYRKLARLKDQFSTWENAWTNVIRQEKHASDPEKDWRKLAELGLRLILRESENFPEQLREIPNPPFGIYLLGNLPKNDNLILAIVGTRKATSDGKELAKKLAAELSANGFTIVSGLALGIDAAAHLGCLEAGGKTIAVLGNGLDYIYPRTNEKIAEKILSQGNAIISEYPPGTQSLPYRFLERNRIVSGLSRGVLVIEAPKESGALVTARFALDQNRDVFVIPGPIAHPNFAGSHQLIRSGAELVTSVEEILQAFGLESNKEKDPGNTLQTAEEKLIFSALTKLSAPASVDTIIELTNMSISEVNRALTFLTIKNVVKETESGYTIN